MSRIICNKISEAYFMKYKRNINRNFRQVHDKLVQLWFHTKIFFFFLPSGIKAAEKLPQTNKNRAVNLTSYVITTVIVF